MTAPGNSPISMVAVEKFVLRPQVILGECILVGFQHAWGDNDTGIPIEARIGGLGWVGIKRCHRLWQGDRLGLGGATIGKASQKLRAFMKGSWVDLVCQKKVAWADLIVIGPVFIVLVKPGQKIRRRCSIPARSG